MFSMIWELVFPMVAVDGCGGFVDGEEL